MTLTREPPAAAVPADLLAAARQAFLAAVGTRRQACAERRFATAGPTLVAALHALYGERADFRPWLRDLCGRLGGFAGARNEALAALDAAREREPDWFVRQRMLGYSAYVDRFAGTLSGVAGRIRHLRALGVDYLHLLPFLRARAGENDGGFAVASFDEIEPALGTMDDLTRLTAQLREAGISLCADLILNHVADDHPWARAARAGDVAKRAFFHVFADRRLPDAYEATLGEVFPQTAPGNFTHVPALGWVWTTFYPYQWDLNYAHPPVFAEIACAMLRLAERGIEVFRLDSAPFLWKRLGTACLNLPEVHTLLVALRAVTALVAPGVLLKAEAIVPAPQVLPYFGSGPWRGRECQLAYHSSLMASGWAALAEGHAELPRALLMHTPPPPESAGWVSYVRCHDDIVWNVLKPLVEEVLGDDFERRIGRAAAFLEGRVDGSFARGAAFQSTDADGVHGSNGMTAALVGLPDDPEATPSAEALRRFALLYGLALWTGAVPLVYMGDELGQGNNDDPADAARIAADGRWLQRPRLSDHALALQEAGRGVPAATFATLRAQVAARRDPRWPALATVEVCPAPERSLLVLRRGPGALAVFNFGATTLTLDLRQFGAGTGKTDLYACGVEGQGDIRTLAPWAVLWQVDSGQSDSDATT